MVEQSDLIIDRPAGSAHPRYPEVIYPLDYGYLVNTQSNDGDGIDIWIGKSGKKQVIGIITTIDLLKRDSEIKILLGCTTIEINTVLAFHNSDQQRGLLIKRDSHHNCVG